MRATAKTALARITLPGLAAWVTCLLAMLFGELSEFHALNALADQADPLTSIKNMRLNNVWR